MSYHEIEDAIESLAYIIHQSSLSESLKKSRLQEIFSFQALFDTSNTLGRIQQILDIYGLHEDTIYLKKIQVLPLFADILELTVYQNKKLARDIYSIFFNAFLNGEIGEENGMSQTAHLLTEDSDFLRIRNILEAYPELCKKDARSEESEDYTYFPNIIEEKEFEKDAEKKAILSLFAEPKKSISQILTSLKKEQSQKILSESWKLLFDFFKEKLSNSSSINTLAKYRDMYQLSFMYPISYEKHAGFQTLCIELDNDTQTMHVSLGFQLENILGWQQREGSPFFELQHDFLNLESFLDSVDTTKNPHLAKFGGWKYDISKSEKILLGHAENIWSVFQKHEQDMRELFFKRVTQFEKFSGESYQKEIRDSQSGDTISEEQHLIFASQEGALAYLIAYHLDLGNLEIAKQYLSLFDMTLPPMASPKRKEKHLAFHQFFEDRTQVFPEFAHMKNITFDASKKESVPCL